MTTIIIPAKGNSMGLPNKNKRMLHDRPLIQWSIDCALSANLGTVYVSTEDAELDDLARGGGASVILRPNHLAAPNIHSVQVVIHAINELGLPEDETVFMLLPTSPFREDSTLVNAQDLINDGASSVVGVAETCPYHSLRRLTCENSRLQAMEGAGNNISTFMNLQRQDVDKLYKVCGGIYAARAGFLLKHQTYHYNSEPLFLDPIEVLDINTEDEFKFAEIIARGLSC